jgi:mono/diheme cytochrome c family protein
VPVTRSLLTALAFTALVVPTGALLAQGPATQRATDPGRSTLDGVYTLSQATQGRDIFAGMCKECHANNVYNGQPLRDRWAGRTLGELFGYLRRDMPKSNPGALTAEEYTAVIAYLLRLNQMPTGSKVLPTDSSTMAGIKFATPAPPSSPDVRR